MCQQLGLVGILSYAGISGISVTSWGGQGPASKKEIQLVDRGQFLDACSNFLCRLEGKAEAVVVMRDQNSLRKKQIL